MTKNERKEFIKQEPMENELAEKTYESLMTRLGSRSTKIDTQMGENLFEDLLLEKSQNLDKFKEAKPVSKTKNSLKKITDQVVFEGKSFVNSKLSADDLVSVSEEQIKTKIGELMETLMNPDSG